MEFKDKVVLISGAASQIGIGHAMACAFAREGARLAIMDIDAEGLAATEATLRELGAEVSAQVADTALTSAVDAAVKHFIGQFGRVDVLVSNAGIARAKPFPEIRDDEFDQVMSVNFGGARRLARSVAPNMLQRGNGVVICISSIAGGAWGWANHSHYSASKAAIEGLVRALAVELGPQGIRVVGVAPGVIRTAQTTDAVNSVGTDGLAALAGLIPLRRVGEPADIADFVLALASSRSRYLTGQTIVVDGGVTLGGLS